MMLTKGIAVLLLCGLSLGCATIVNKDIVSVPVYTDPPGARLFIAGRVYYSPDIVKVPRGQGDFTMTVEKPGYQSERVILQESMDTWWAWNVIFPGLLHMVDDLVTKRAYDIDPEVVHLKLVKLPE